MDSYEGIMAYVYIAIYVIIFFITVWVIFSVVEKITDFIGCIFENRRNKNRRNKGHE